MAGGGVTVYGGQRITAAMLNTNIPGPWNPPTSLSANWSAPAGYQTMQWRYLNSTTVHIVAWMQYSAATAGTAVGWATMPFATISDQRGFVFAQASGATTYSTGQARMASNNSLTLYATSGAASTYYLNWVLPLDL